MKKNSILILSVLIASMLLVASVSAENGDGEFTANGKMTHYSDYEDPERGSEIVGGTWHVEIVDGVVDFDYFYRELNLREEIELSPEGSIDLFKGYLTSEDYLVGEGYVEIWGLLHVDKMMWFLDDYSTIELPPWFDPEWIPEHAPAAWITDFLEQEVHITITPYDIVIENGNLDKLGITLSYHPRDRAELTFWDIPRVKTYDDTLPAGDHLSEVTHRLWIHNIDDIFDADIVDPGFHVETEGVSLTWVDWELYADWGDTYADWDFPEEFTIPEDHGDGPGFGVDRTEMINLDFAMTRQMDPPIIEADGTHTASFTLEFTDTDCEWCNGYIQTHEGWDLNAIIVPGSFWTDAPLWDWGQGDSHSLWFDLVMDSVEVGTLYHFSVEISVELTDNGCPPILYMPGFGINHLVDDEWRAGGEGETVEIPPDMRPDYITEAWVSTDASYTWTLGWRNEINAYMEEVLMLAGEHAEFMFREILESSPEGDVVPAGVQECTSVFVMEIHNLDDTSDADVGDPGFYVETSETLTWVDLEEYADWDETHSDWDLPAEWTIPETESLSTNFGVDHTEECDLTLSVSRAMNEIDFYDDGIQEVCITVTIFDTDQLGYFGHIAAHEHEGVSASIVPGSFWTDAPIWGSWETIHWVNFDMDMEYVEAGVPYQFWVQVNVDLTGEEPMTYKPHFDMVYRMQEEVTFGGVGYSVSMPPEMLPDYITDAQASADTSISWALMSANEVRAQLGECVGPVS